MAVARAVLLATCDTKARQIAHLRGRLRQLGLASDIVDIAPGAGARLAGTAKLAAMQQAAQRAARQIRAAAPPDVLIGLGGGTGAQIVADAYRQLPASVPKVLVATVANDARRFAAGPLVLICAQADLAGSNPLVRRALDDAAAAAAGLAGALPAAPAAPAPLVALSALGATEGLAGAAQTALAAAGYGAVVFHASYHGGGALCSWLAGGSCAGFIDATVHELTSLLLDAGTVVPAQRFCAGASLPRVVLPGAVNVRTCGPLAGLDAAQRASAHYAHSPEFTHVALSDEQLARAGTLLGAELAKTGGPLTVIVPMGGFSAEDCPGGRVENPAGREAFAAALGAALPARAEVLKRPEHINDAAVGALAVERLLAGLAADPQEAT